MAGWQNGLCRGLQILLYWFDSGTGLQKKTYLQKKVKKSVAILFFLM